MLYNADNTYVQFKGNIWAGSGINNSGSNSGNVGTNDMIGVRGWGYTGGMVGRYTGQNSQEAVNI